MNLPEVNANSTTTLSVAEIFFLKYNCEKSLLNLRYPELKH